MKGNFFLHIYILLIVIISCQENYENEENEYEDNYDYDDYDYGYDKDPFDKFEDNNKYITNIKNYNDYLLNIKNTTKGKFKVLLIYSNSCPHCLRFVPKYYNVSISLSNIKNIQFLRINSNVYDKFSDKTEFQIRGYPEIFIYQEQKFIQYLDNHEEKELTDFIQNQYSYKCKQINVTYLNYLFNETLMYSNINQYFTFILGIFYNESFIINENNIKIYNKLNSRQGNLIESAYCFYFFYTNDIVVNHQLLKYFVLNEKKSYIYLYNHQKGYINFPYYNNKYISLNFSEKYMQNLEKNYIELIAKNTFPYYFTFKNALLPKILKMNKKILIFSFQNNEQEKLFLENIKTILGFKSVKENYLILLKDINDEKSSLYKYFNQPGIYYSKNFRTDEIVILLDKNKTLYEQKEKVLNKSIEFINLKEKQEIKELTQDDIKINIKKGIEMLNNVIKYFETPKNETNIKNNNTITENNTKKNIKIINQNLKKEKGKINNKNGKRNIKIDLIYFIIYSTIFYIIFKKYIKKKEFDIFIIEEKEIKII